MYEVVVVERPYWDFAGIVSLMAVLTLSHRKPSSTSVGIAVFMPARLVTSVVVEIAETKRST